MPMTPPPRFGRRAFLGASALLLAGAARSQPDPGALSLKERGAVGDGRSHPLSERFRTLRDAQRVHPHATALDQESDWAALQGAILDLSRSGFGGTVTVPPGRYRLNADLVLPNLDQGDDSFNEVEIRGSGMRSTVLSWTEDLGPGRFALRAGSRDGGPDRDGYQRTRIADLTLLGPRPGNRPGDAPPGMGGVAVTSRFVLDRLGIYGFRAGVDVWRDHSSLLSCQIAKNHVGVHWSKGTRSFGDHLLLDADLAGNTLASIAVDPENGIDHSSFIGCHFGFSPYGILAEDGAPARSFLSNNKLIDCAFEACGNGWIRGPEAEMHGNSLIGCSGSLLPRYRLAGRPVTGLIVVRTLERNLFLGGTASFGDGTPGIETAVVVAEDAVGNRFEDGEQLVRMGRDGGPDGGVPALSIARACRANRFQAVEFSGEFLRVGEGGVAGGELVQRDYDRARRAGADKPVLGVAMAGGPAGNVVPIATAGQVPVAKTAAAIRMGAVLRPAAGQPQRVDAGNGATAPIGIATTDAAEGAATVTVELRLTTR
ncbi:DUF2190 family protein [Azospirillum doebereinerae]|nr:DUF2190 family protein [Azospirillum doebereinerae]